MASPWPIGETRQGYCAATDGEEPGDCETGESGSWSTSGIRGLDECATKCVSCTRCRFVTYGESAWLRRAWPRIEWGEGDRGVRERMSTREKEWAMRAWRGAWSAVHDGLP